MEPQARRGLLRIACKAFREALEAAHPNHRPVTAVYAAIRRATEPLRCAVATMKEIYPGDRVVELVEGWVEDAERAADAALDWALGDSDTGLEAARRTLEHLAEVACLFAGVFLRTPVETEDPRVRSG